MIDLSKNVNPYYPKKEMLRFIKKNIKKVEYYPSASSIIDNNYFNIFNINNNNIMVTSGGMDGINIVLKSINKTKAGYFNPTFWGFDYNAKLNKYEIVKEILNDGINYSIKDIQKLVSKVDVIYICNSNNPTLSYINSKKLYKLIKKNPQTHFLIDETILLFNEKFEEKTMIKYISKLQNFSVIISCSKIFNISGLRIGLLFSNENSINTFKKNKLIYSTNSLAETYIKKYINEFGKLDKSRKKIKNNFEEFTKLLNCKYIEKIINEDGSFILAKINNNTDINTLVNYIKEHNILVCHVNNYYKNLDGNYIRISAGKKRQLKKLSIIMNMFDKENKK